MAEFRMDGDAVNPESLPKRILRDGTALPAIGLGTFGSDNYSAPVIAEAVDTALRLGYRLIDCASCYGNQSSIGEVFHAAISSGLKRDELTVISKVWNDSHAPEDVIISCKKTLTELKLDYLDCFLVHWPFRNAHAPGCDGDTRNPNARRYSHEEYMETWRAMELLHDIGLVKNIGVSNMTIKKLIPLFEDARIMPAVNEMELHPSFQQGELYQFCIDHNIQPIGYCPIGSPSRPQRDRAADDIADTQMEEIVKIARAHGVHPAVICLKWAVQRGQIPIPFSVKREQMLANLKAAAGQYLTPREMESIRTCERNCRLIKGQVFLWPEARDWMDLWDI